MELLTGMGIGALAVIVIVIVIRLIRSASKSGPRRPSITPEEQLKLNSQMRTYEALSVKYDSLSTRDGYVTLQREVESKRSSLSEEGYEQLTRAIGSAIKRIDDEVAARIIVDPKLAKFAALKNITDPELLFTELHRITITKDGVISEDELFQYGKEDDVVWLTKSYDKLLLEHFRKLLVTARQGTVADYQKVMKLWEELSEYYSDSSEDRDDMVESYLAEEWNEMIVRFKREVDWNEDLYGYDDLRAEAYPEIFRKAREDKDLLSIQVSLMLANEDPAFVEAVAETRLKDLRDDLDTQLLAIGFKPDEEERSV